MAEQVVRLKGGEYHLEAVDILSIDLSLDWTSIREAAKTVNLAFSNDPLINWIRPGARPWAELDDESLRFQHRRVQRMREEFVVLQLGQSAHYGSGRKHIKSANVSIVEAANGGFGSDDHGAIAMLEPPQKKGSKLRQLYLELKFWLKDTLNPVRDPGGSMEVRTLRNRRTHVIRGLIDR